jgi:uncharacterized membrane protein YidH (DUF202 family)
VQRLRVGRSVVGPPAPPDPARNPADLSPHPADPRVYFAAERTLLAWLRTGIAIMAFGFVVARFGLFLRLLHVQEDTMRVMVCPLTSGRCWWS